MPGERPDKPDLFGAHEEAACCYLTGGSILTHVAWGAGGPCGLAAVAQDGSAHRLEATRREGHPQLAATGGAW